MAGPGQAVLLLAFGGPRSRTEVGSFLATVARGRPIAPERLAQVISHYEVMGGASPIGQLTFRQARALEQALARRGCWLPVYVAMRSWHPFIHETMANMAEEGIGRVRAVVLSPHRSEAGYDRYLQEVERCRKLAGEEAPAVDFAPPWHDHPLFVAAQAECLQEGLARLRGSEDVPAMVLFTAHSIPEEMARASAYQEQVEESARLVAERVGHARWSVAYQSRSGRAGERWLGPDVSEALRALAAQGVSAAVVVPIGFVCDHVEILFDLDIEARAVARAAGLEFVRAPALNDRPAFIEMLAELVTAGPKLA